MGHICQLVNRVIINLKLKFKINLATSGNTAIISISAFYIEMLANLSADLVLTAKLKADKSMAIMENCSK